MTMKQNKFGEKYGNEESITKAECVNNIETDLQVLEGKYILILLEQHYKKYQIGKR